MIYERDGRPNRAVVVGRTPPRAPDARVDATETATLAQLTSLEQSPVGSRGEVSKGPDGLLRWKATA